MKKLLIVTLSFSFLICCQNNPTYDDCEGGKILEEISPSQATSEISDSLNNEPFCNSYSIELDGEKICCDDAYTNLEMALCTRYVIDSLTLKMDSLYHKIIKEVAFNLSDKDSIDRECNLNVQHELINSQKVFLKNIEAERKLIEAMHQGRESIFYQNSHEITSLENRIALFETLWFQ